ncbi:LytR/AlgR family response regulator transcription factor [Ulvibacter antarcticus]|uniref:LytTr DNA-binding domain-containing protein n=1 Tax=Ulvibacter antarcticus TaxID=442714 RepID=A0A3L9YCE7_9FLAO|nr:LytTR family DNA-binding domain-containing protein [Ulvibacter antarcticus]RMA57167.1 LytTr DNA-binding domain-containing protein [Ulvibacter antarcticus]
MAFTLQSIHDSYSNEEISDNLQSLYKSRFLSKINHSIFSIPVTDILYFSFEDHNTVIITKSYRTFVIDYSLENLVSFLNPKHFFRINRKVILHIESIKKMNLLSKSRIEIVLNNNEKQIVSRSKTSAFKTWLEY